MPDVKLQGGSYLLQSAAGSELVFSDFDASSLRAQSRWRGELSGGRGQVWFATLGDIEIVIRRYRRGGLMSRLSESRYLWTGLTNTRVYRELQLLEQLVSLGLPVSVPVGGRLWRRGFHYEAALVTQRIEGAKTLAQRISGEPLSASCWASVGRLIRRFHDLGVWHADLNANNILFDAKGDLLLIDFDRGRIRPHQDKWKQTNLARLERSLVKIASRNPGLYYSEADLRHLRNGYGA